MRSWRCGGGEAVGETENRPFQFSFNSSLRVDFQGARVTSGGGLILVRELDERLGLSELMDRHLSDSRRGKNIQLPLADLLRQSIYSRLAGYEDVNDAARLSQDPTFRLIGSRKIWERGAALTSRLQSFETEVLTQEENLAGLAALNRELLARAEAIDARRRVVLDMDSTEVRVHGRQEQSAYNGHFESTCYHPLLLFNREGDCLAAKLRPGNVHSADGWEELLLPEIERQQTLGKEVVFRGDAAFAKRALRGVGRTDGEVRHSPSGQRQSAADDYGVVDPAGGTAEPQAGGGVQKLSLSGGELDDSPAGGGEGRVPLRGIVPPRGVHRDQSWDFKPGGGALLQQARHGRTVDQGRQAGGKDDAA
jgi:Transposase DDE domain group 1